jgi:hypothetical protein
MIIRSNMIEQHSNVVVKYSFFVDGNLSTL